MILAPKKLGRHNNAFLVGLGLGSALINGGVFWWLLSSTNIANTVSSVLISVTVGGAAFVAFYSFQLLLSARSVGWMLGQGIIRWLRILFVSLFVLLLFAYDDFLLEDFRLLIIEWVIVAVPLQMLLLFLSRRLALIVNTAASNRRKAIFIGMGAASAKLARRLARSPILGLEVVGYYAPEPLSFDPDDVLSQYLSYLGSYREAVEKMESSPVGVVFLTMNSADNQIELQLLADYLYDSTASIYFMPELAISEDYTVYGVEMAGVPLLALHETAMLGASRFFKRLVDVSLALLGIIVLSPILFLVAVLIKLDSPGPVIYRQKRYGERGHRIDVFKFRSMRDDIAQTGFLQQAQKDDDRITRVGRFLRRSSLDELPQLFNVLQGTMSLVGPRPHAVSHNEYYRGQIRGYMLRHSVKPGITGWAQVNGLRGETDTVEKMHLRVQYDRFYITHWSLWLDFKILFLTVLRVIWDKKAY